MLPARPSVSRRLIRFGVALVAVVLPASAGVSPTSASDLPSMPTAVGVATAGPAIIGHGCAPSTGVTVVVDFTALADIVELGCALGPQTSGFAALRNAGFGVNVDSDSYPGTVCTIDGAPTQGYPYCWTGGGTWAYWTSTGSNAWAYSIAGAVGVGALPVGSVQGWSWTQGLANPNVAPRLTVASLPDHDDATRRDAAIAWTKRELADNGWRMPGFTADSTDVGLTTDALLALAADGRSATPAAARVTQVVEDNTTNYVSWAPDFPDVTVAGAMAKVLLVAEVQGVDSSDFGGWDLEAELRSMMQSNGDDAGRFSDHDTEFDTDSSNGFSQALAVLALDRTAGGVPSDAVDYLLAQQCPGGGFRVSYSSGSACTSDADADTDATALAVQALLTVDRDGPVFTASLSTAVGWLLAQQDAPTGAFGGTGVTAGVNGNSSGLVAQTVRAAGQVSQADAAAAWIASVQPMPATAGHASADLGAIAYNQGAFDGAVADGIVESGRDQWRRTTAQAVLAFGLPPMGSINDATPVAPVDPVGPDHFSDVATSHPFHADITWLVAAGVANGYVDGTFRPSDLVTRQANAAFLYRLAGSPDVITPPTPTFSDVPESNAFYAQIEWMYGAGLTTGYPDGTFRPTGTVQRQAVAAFLYRLAGSPEVPVDAPSFTDVPSGHPFHDAISWAASRGITTGYPDGTFRPGSPVSRQAIAAFVHRYALLP